MQQTEFLDSYSYRNASRINLLDTKVKACDIKNPICQLQVWPVDQRKLIEIELFVMFNLYIYTRSSQAKSSFFVRNQ